MMSNNDVILLYFQHNFNGEERPPCPPGSESCGGVETDGPIKKSNGMELVAPPGQRMQPRQHSTVAVRILATDEKSRGARVSNMHTY